MKVIRLNGSAFEQSCKDLGKQLQGYSIDLIIGIESGGAVVAKSMIKQNGLENIAFDSIRIRRKSSSTIKERGIVKKTILYLPEFLIRLLRKMEMYTSEVKAKYKTPEREVNICLGEHSKDLARNGAKILIVDDALDTGRTMQIAKEYFIELNPSNEVLTAVLTVTHKNPLVKSDFSLYNRTILQFPWALDGEA